MGGVDEYVVDSPDIYQSLATFVNSDGGSFANETVGGAVCTGQTLRCCAMQ